MPNSKIYFENAPTILQEFHEWPFHSESFSLAVGAILTLLIAQSADIKRFVSVIGMMSAPKVCIASFWQKFAQIAMLPHKRSQPLPSTTEQLPSTTEQLPSTTEQLASTAEQLPSNYRALPSNYWALPRNYRALPSNYRALPSNYRATTNHQITLLWAVLSSLVANSLPSVLRTFCTRKAEI